MPSLALVDAARGTHALLHMARKNYAQYLSVEKKKIVWKKNRSTWRLWLIPSGWSLTSSTLPIYPISLSDLLLAWIFLASAISVKVLWTMRMFPLHHRTNTQWFWGQWVIPNVLALRCKDLVLTLTWGRGSFSVPRLFEQGKCFKCTALDSVFRAQCENFSDVAI